MTLDSTVDAATRDGAVERVRELEAAHEIAQAFLAASQPIEVYRLALVRLTPMVRADFAAVFLRDEKQPDILKPAAAQGWPQSSARYLGRLRIRVGAGPTGRAVAESRTLEVEDIFGDDGLTAWWEPARELGFASMITLPLKAEGPESEPVGALSFYFVEPRRFTDEERRLLGLIARQLGSTSRRARVVSDLRADADRYRRESEAMAERVRDAESRALAHDQLLLEVIKEMSAVLGVAHSDAKAWGATVPMATVASIESAVSTTGDLRDLLALRLGYRKPSTGAEDAAWLAREAARIAGTPPEHVHFAIEVGDSLLPITTDGRAVTRVLSILLRQAFHHTVRGAVDLDVRTASGDDGSAIEWRVRVRGLGIESSSSAAESRSAAAGRAAESLALAVAGEYARVLGGTLTAETEAGVATVFRLCLPLRHGADSD
ncbi:MAG: ATP-binding protein [Gemmatimonadota bacterium]|jgi:GAF domain-containing protein